MESRIADKFRIGEMINTGSSAKIYEGTNIQTKEAVMIKLERTKGTQLLHEAKVYKALKGPGFPNLKCFGVQGDYTILVMDLLGPSLKDLLDFCSGKLSLKTVLMLADQMIERVEYLHSKSYLHRNIEPKNFLMGPSNHVNQVYVVDFGVAKKFRDSRTLQHIPYRENKNLIGSVRFASMSAHRGLEQGRRDDLESLGFVLVYFLKGGLPWEKVKASSKEQNYEKRKVSTPIEDICRGCPSEFASYLHYCRSLRFDDKPDYAYLKRIFRDLYTCSGFQFDNIFDWTILKYQSSQLAAPPPRALNPPGWLYRYPWQGQAPGHGNPTSPGLGHVGPSWSGPGPSWSGLGHVGPSWSGPGPSWSGLGPSWSGPGPSWSNPPASQVSSSRRLDSRAAPSEKSSFRSDKAYKNFRP